MLSRGTRYNWLLGEPVPQSRFWQQNHTSDGGIKQHGIRPNHEPGSNTTNEHISLIYIRIHLCPTSGQWIWCKNHINAVQKHTGVSIILLNRHQSTFSSVILANVSTQEKTDVSLRVSDSLYYIHDIYACFPLSAYVCCRPTSFKINGRGPSIHGPGSHLFIAGHKRGTSSFVLFFKSHLNCFK